MRAMRLRRTKDIQLVRESGEMRTDGLFTVRARPNGLDVVRVAVASPRSLGDAVRRNRARRRVREAFRVLLGGRRAAPGTDLFVVARRPALEAPPEALRGAVAKQLDSLLSRLPGAQTEAPGDEVERASRTGAPTPGAAKRGVSPSEGRK